MDRNKEWFNAMTCLKGTLLSLLWVVSLAYFVPSASFAKDARCNGPGVHVQVLGSGGPELDDERASSSYLIWQDGRARVLVDLGPGSLLQFERSGARVEDIDLVLLSHLHVDHSADLPALIKGSYFTARRRELSVFGPTGNHLMPDTAAFVATLFQSPNGAFRYLDGFLNNGEAYRIRPESVEANGRAVQTVWSNDGLTAAAVPVHHHVIPALAWRVKVGERVIVFSGDMNGDNNVLGDFAEGADLLVAHHSIPELTFGGVRTLHMTPSTIGDIAAAAAVKQLVLSHRMSPTIGREDETQRVIRERYDEPIAFADDGQCFTP